MGANDKPAPKIKWQREVHLFVKLYPKTVIKATGDK